MNSSDSNKLLCRVVRRFSSDIVKNISIPNRLGLLLHEIEAMNKNGDSVETIVMKMLMKSLNRSRSLHAFWSRLNSAICRTNFGDTYIYWLMDDYPLYVV
jgi:hypothetical protein